MLDLLRQIDLEPIGRIVPRGVGGEIVIAPLRQLARNSSCACATRRLRSIVEWPPASTISVSQ